MTAHVAQFADGSGLLFDEELQIMAPLSDGIAAPQGARRVPAADDTAPDESHPPAWSLRCRSAAAWQSLAPLLHASPRAAGSAVTLEIIVEPGRTSVVGPTTSAICLHADELLPLAKNVLLTELLAQDAVALHGAALSRNGRCLLLAGAPGSGKSTLSAALLHAGYGYAADDVLLIKKGVIHGLALPLAVKEGSWDLLASRYPQLRGQAPHRRPDGLTVKYLSPVSTLVPARAGWIVFPHYRPLAPLALDPIDQATAYRRLIAEAHAPSHRLAGEAFHTLAGWMQQACCYNLQYSHLDDALAAVHSLDDAAAINDRAEAR